MTVSHISQSLRALLLAQCSAEQLFQLASLKREESPGLVARRQLDEASIDELVDMICACKIPTVGWWKRHMVAAA